MLSAHFFMNFKVVDEHGRQLGMGRNLGALKAELGSQARGAFQALAGLKLEKSGSKLGSDPNYLGQRKLESKLGSDPDFAKQNSGSDTNNRNLTPITLTPISTSSHKLWQPG
jgi:hypothetical protein